MLRQRQKELLEENRMLHEELKKSVVHEILQGTGHQDPVCYISTVCKHSPDADRFFSTLIFDYGKWTVIKYRHPW